MRDDASSMTTSATAAAPTTRLIQTAADRSRPDQAVATSDRTTAPTRGKARALWRKARAVEMALAGWSYDEIAAEVGYANRGTAWRVVSQALTEQAHADLDLHRALELARLDRLIASNWGEATGGHNVRAAELVLKVISQRSKLLGLDAGAAVRASDQTLVIRSEHYVPDLQRVVGAIE